MRTRLRAAAAIASASMLAVACGGGSKGSSGGGGGTNGGASGTQAPATLTPKPGGKLVMGTEAEIDGFDPTKNRFDVTGLQYATTVYDPLTTIGKDNKPHPYLAQSLTPNADYTVWTIKLRPNITFSNNDPVNADAVVADLQAQLKSALVGPALTNIASVAKVDDLTLTVTCKASWVPFPIYLAGQAGMVFDPKMLTDPQGSQHPIGSGPFILDSWVPGNHFIAKKNPNYWQKGLPYLDSIEYRPILETQSRDNSLANGGIDILHSSDVQTTQDLKGVGSVNLTSDINSKGEVEEGFIQINTAQAPLDDVTLRTALAYATDRARYRDVIDFGIPPDSTGPFGNTGSAYHADTGYPNFDLSKAKQLVKQYEQAHNVTSVTFELGTTNVGRNLQAASILQDMWKQAGVTVTIKQVEQSQFILLALEGKYNAYLWRQFGEPDPDADNTWWASAQAAPIGKLALNFVRNKDPQIDADLLKGRSSTNEADRTAAYQDIARRFAVDIPYLWLGEAVWQVGTKKNVHGLFDWTLPDGSPGVDHTLGGLFLMSHVWVS